MKLYLVKEYDGEDFYPCKVFKSFERAQNYQTTMSEESLKEGTDLYYLISKIEADLDE